MSKDNVHPRDLDFTINEITVIEKWREKRNVETGGNKTPVWCENTTILFIHYNVN